MISQKVRYVAFGATMLVIITCVLAVVMLTGSTGSSESADGSTSKVPQPIIITRQDWQAQQPTGDLTPLKLPVTRVIILHTVTKNCRNQTACMDRSRLIQKQHMEIFHFDDIGYNFLIGGDGNVYEGRGWSFSGAFVRGQNSKAYGIAFIGDYIRDMPTEEQMDALDALLESATGNGYLTSDFKLFGARQFQATESPGQNLYERLKSYAHWTDTLDSV